MRRAALWTALALAACGSPPPLIDNSSPLNACRTMNRLMGLQVAHCHGAPAGRGFVNGLYTDARPELFDFTCAPYAQSVSAGRATFDRNLFVACEQAIQTKACDDPSPYQGCDALYHGTVAPRGACSTEFDCADGAACLTTGTACQSACAILVGPGGACLDRQHDCEPGLWCIGNPTSPSTCQAPAGVGAHCTVCAQDLYCDANTICQALITAGQPCGGAACRWGLQCFGPTGGTLTCQTPKMSGDPCVAGLNQCAHLLYCREGHCVDLPNVGEPCGTLGVERDVGCFGGYCIGSVCVPPIPVGGACKATGGAPCLYPSFCLATGTATEGTCTEAPPCP
jgi:hypothetical protein